MRTKEIAAGTRFGRLVVTERGPNKHGHTGWWCSCDCGSQTLSDGTQLRRGQKVSCGCAKRERTAALKLSHGWRASGNKHPLYETWRGMIARCNNPNHVRYHRYGGRGITVCERWANDFVVFAADVGPKPSPRHSLDRINNDGHYEPSNVRWATPPDFAGFLPKSHRR